MAHPSSCDNARSPGCRCGWCGGSLHGWPGALTLAGPGKDADRVERRAAQEEEWVDANRSVPVVRLTRRKARAAVATAKADIIDWMSTGLSNPPASMPKAVDQLIEQLGDNIANDALDALDKALGTKDRRKAKADLAAGHLFCSLLAALAHAMQEFDDDLNKAVSEVVGRITSYVIGRKRIKHSPFMVKVIVGAAAKSISQVMQHLTPAQNFKHVKLAVRILAVMACPEPEKHEEVVRFCLQPLGEPIISAGIQKRLKETMPGWVS